MNARAGIICLFTVFFAGCVTPPQTPIQLSDTALSSTAGRVGVAMAPLPKPDTQFPGAGCLLCMATASMANSALTTHTQTLPHEDLPKLKAEVADLLRKKGTDAMVIPDELKIDALADYKTETPNVARKDFSPLKQKYKIDKLVMIQIDAVGVSRPYSAYISTGDPQAMLRGAGYLVNLSNNTYEWYLPVTITKNSDGSWDEPPKFPGLTNAYFQVLEQSRDTFLKPFKTTTTATTAR